MLVIFGCLSTRGTNTSGQTELQKCVRISLGGETYVSDLPRTLLNSSAQLAKSFEENSLLAQKIITVLAVSAL